MTFERIEDAIAHMIHVEWALSLQPGDKVLTNWNESIPEYASELPWGLTALSSTNWHKTTIRKVLESDNCESGVLVSLQEMPDEWDDYLDSGWIKSLECNDK